MRRVISVWLPTFATDRLCRQTPAWRSEPLATATAAQGGLRIVAANHPARDGGILPGLLLADARALIPGLRVIDADPVAEAKALALLADWCGRYTPWTAVDGVDGLWLDIAGCAHLFDGEAALADDIGERLGGLGFEARVGLADSPGAAWAAARFLDDRKRLIAVGAARLALVDLPAAALRLPIDVVEGLERMGLGRIGDLLACPRAPLIARFGPLLGARIDQALDRVKEPISPRRPAPCWRTRLGFPEPLCREEDIATAARRLIERLCARLALDQRGVRRIELVLYLVDGKTHGVAVGTSQPERDPKHLMRLLSEHLEGFDPGFGVEVAVLAAPLTEPLGAAQLTMAGTLDDQGQPADDTALAAAIGRLVDSLSNRVGAANVSRFAARESHVPERAVYLHPALEAALDTTSGAIGQANPQRPLRVFPHPELVEAVAPVPDDPPVLFRWRRRVHRIVHADGPERISPEWWRHGKRGIATRDYYRVEDSEGRRFWLYREGLYRPEARPRWFLHGLFA